MSLRHTSLHILSAFLIFSSLSTHAQPSTNSKPLVQATPNEKSASQTANPLTQALKQFEIQLTLPGPQWRILNQAQLRSLSTIATAGAFNPKQVLGLVLVETLKDMDLNDYATALMENSSLKELLIESVSEVRFQNQKALRLVYSGDEANGRFRYLAYVFISGQKGYQVVSGGPVAIVDQAKLELFASAVKLNPINQNQASKLKPSTQVDEYGLTWRLKEGIFRHSLSGLKLDTNQSWTSVAGSSLAHINQEAIAALINQENQVHIIFFDRPCPSSDPQTCRTWVRYELFKDLGLESIDESYQYDYLGEAQKFQRLTHERGLYTYLYNVQIKAGRALQTLAWTLHPKVTQDPNQNELAFAEAWRDLPSAFKQITMLSTQERSQLLLELKKQTDPKAFMHKDSSWMWGKYHHFNSGLTWQRPSGLWNLTAVSSSAKQEQDLITISSPRYGINAQIRIVSTYQHQAKEAHQLLWTELKQQLTSTRGNCTQISQGTRQLAQASSAWTRCTFKQKTQQNSKSNQSEVELAWTYQLDSFHAHGSIIHLLTWGPQALYEGKAEVVRESLESELSIASPATVMFTADRHLIDERFRYQLKDLPAHGEVRVRSNLNLGKAGSLVEYSTSQLSIQSFALSQMDQQHLTRLIEQLAHKVTIKHEQTKHPLNHEQTKQILNQQSKPNSPKLSKPSSPEQASKPSFTPMPKLKREVVWLGEHSAEKLTWPNLGLNLQRSALLISVPPVVYGIVAVGSPQDLNNILSAQHFELSKTK